MIGIRRLGVAILFAGMSLLQCAPAGADELACKPGAQEETYARANYALPPLNFYQLRGEFDAWAEEQGIASGGTGTYDPKTRVHTWSSILASKEHGVTVTVHFSTAEDQVTVTAKNGCLEEQEDWRPLWAQVNAELLKRGYRPQ